MAWTLINEFQFQRYLPKIGVSIKPARGFNPAAPVTDDQQIAMLQEVGAKVCRIDIPWSNVETVAGVYNLDAYYPLFNRLRELGIFSVIILGRGNQLYTGAWDAPPRTEAARTAFANYAKAIVAKFGAAWAWYEIYNEPNAPINWSGASAATEWAQLVNTTAAAIRSLRSDAIIVTGGLAVFEPEAFIATAAPIFNPANLTSIGFHPYTGADAYISNPLMTPEGVKERMDSFKTAAGNILPPCNTEQGFELNKCAGSTTADKLKRQAVFASRFILTAIRSSNRFAIWYDLVDDGTDMNNPEHGLGLYDYNFNIKPAGLAFKRTMNLVNGCESCKIYRDGDSYKVDFTMPGGVVKTLLWTRSFTTAVSTTAAEGDGPMEIEYIAK